jgi:hypothetical protein
MIRHEALSTQTATLPLRPAGDLAPIRGQAAPTNVRGHICFSKVRFVGALIEQHDPGNTPPPFARGLPKAGQIQNYP